MDEGLYIEVMLHIERLSSWLAGYRVPRFHARRYDRGMIMEDIKNPCSLPCFPFIVFAFLRVHLVYSDCMLTPPVQTRTLSANNSKHPPLISPIHQTTRSSSTTNTLRTNPLSISATILLPTFDRYLLFPTPHQNNLPPLPLPNTNAQPSQHSPVSQQSA